MRQLWSCYARVLTSFTSGVCSLEASIHKYYPFSREHLLNKQMTKRVPIIEHNEYCSLNTIQWMLIQEEPNIRSVRRVRYDILVRKAPIVRYENLFISIKLIKVKYLNCSSIWSIDSLNRIVADNLSVVIIVNDLGDKEALSAFSKDNQRYS